MRSNLHGWIHPCILSGKLNHSTVCIQSVYTFNSIAVKVCLTFFSFMSDEEIQSSPERTSARIHHSREADNPTSNPTADAFSLFSKHLDSTLEKQKKEIFKSFQIIVTLPYKLLKKSNKILLLVTKLLRLVTSMFETPLASMKVTLLLITLMMSAVFDRPKPGQFVKERQSHPKTHQRNLQLTNFFVALEKHLKQEAIQMVHKQVIMVKDPVPQTSELGKDHLPKTHATTVVPQDTGRLTVQKANSLTTPAVPNEVLSLIDFNLCLDTYEFENESVQVYNVKGRLYNSLQFWKEKLLLADS